MRGRTSALVAALVALAAASAALAAGSPPPTATIATRGAVGPLALDGARLAYVVRAPAGCTTVHVRDLRTGKDAILSGRRTCAADSTSTGAGVRELALAGRRAAWIVNLGGNSESADALYGATVGGVREHLVATAFRRGSVDGTLQGGWLGHLEGAGELFVLNRWQTGRDGDVVASSLRAIERGLRTIVAGPESLAAAAATPAQVGILQDDGTIVVRDPSGARRSAFTPTGAAREVALTPTRIVVLEAGRLEVARTSDGARLREIPIPAGARSLDAYGDLAAFAAGRAVYVADLRSGRVALAARAPKAVGDVQLDAGGLAHAFDRVTGVAGRGVIVVTPLARVRAGLR